MSESFSNLHWFIREDVINRVISVNRNYCLINKEWFKYVSKIYSVIHFGRNPRKGSVKVKPLFIKYSEKVEFNRTYEIAWKKIYNRNIKTVILSQPTATCHDKFFVDKFLKITNLENLELARIRENVDGTRILKHFQANLKSLSLHGVSLSGFPIGSKVFPNLFSLSLGLSEPFSFQDLTIRMPKLKKLHLRLNVIEHGIIPPPNAYINEIVELRLSFYYRNYTYYEVDDQGWNRHEHIERVIKLDLPRFPKLRKLYLDGKFKLIESISPSVEELKITNCENISNVLLPTFCNLRKLCLKISTRRESEVKTLADIMELGINLTHLHLIFEYTIPNFTNPNFTLPEGSFLIPNLKISGLFPLKLCLNWVLNNFDLEVLELNINAKSPGKVDFIPSDNLKHVIARTQNKPLIIWYKKYFHQEHYPKLQLLEFTPDTDSYHLCSDFI